MKSDEERSPDNVRQSWSTAHRDRWLASAVMDAAREGMLMLGLDLRVKAANAAFHRMFRLRDRDIEGESIYALADGRWNVPEMHALLEDVLPTEVAVDAFEVVYHVENLGERTLLLNVRRLDRADLILLAVEDVTAARRAEDEARRIDAQYRRVLHASGMVAARVDRDLRYTWIYNPHPDFDPSEVIGRRDDELAENEGIDQLMAFKRRVLHTGQSAREEIAFPLTDGNVVYAVRGEPILDDEGDVAGLVTVSLDITERVEVSQRLRTSEATYRALFENAAVGAGRFSLDGSILELNDRFCEITGRTREELLALGFQAITHPDDVVEDDELTAALVAGEIKDYRIDKRYLWPDGSIVWVRLSVALVHAPDGTPTFVSIAEDITSRKMAETALQQFATELEERVRTRTRQVYNLSRELTLAEHRERHRIARVLHDDLQQELYALQIMLYRAQRDESRESQIQGLDEASSTVRRLISMGRTLTSELSPPVLDDEGLPEALRWLLSHMREKYGLKTRLIVEGSDPRPATDMRVLLFQASRELLFNVVKHADTDQATVRLNMNASQVAITVEDRGSGFDPTDMGRHEAGFGLTTVRRRLELLGGQLRVEAREGSGTRATAILPLDTEAGNDDRDRRNADSARGPNRGKPA